MTSSSTSPASGVQIAEGEIEPPVQQAVQIPEPVRGEVVLEQDGSSPAEKEWEQYTVDLTTNRVSAVGDPKRSLLSVMMPAAKLAFIVTIASSVIMALVEGSLNIEVTRTVMGPVATFAVIFVIAVLSNLLILFGVEQCHHLLTYKELSRYSQSLILR